MKLLFSTLVFLLAATSAGASEPQARYRVAAILPLTGDGASWGTATKSGIEIALSKLPPAVRERMEVVFEDDALLPKNTVGIFRQLTARGPLHAVINVTSGTGNALAPLAESAGVTMFSIASDSRIARGRKYVFMFYLTPEDEIRAGIEEMRRRGYRTVAEVVAIQEGYIAGQEAFRAQQGTALKTVYSEQFPPDVKDFRSSIAKLRRVSPPPHAILVLLMPGQVGPFARQLRDAGANMPLVGGINFESRAEVESSNGALVGQWFISNGAPQGDFLEEYRRRHPDYPLASATNGHDAAAILARAVAENIDPKSLPDYLRGLKTFEGASGTLRIAEDGRFIFPATIKVVPPN